MIQELFKDFLFYFQAGGFVMYPLVLATFFLWYAIGYRYHALKRGSTRSVRTLVEAYRQGEQRAPGGVIDHAIIQGIVLARSGREDLRRYLDDTFSLYVNEIGRYRVLVRTLVGFAPLAGLLGTVAGMIETFDSLGDMSLFSQSGGIAGGISKALFTTQMGLVVSVPGLIVGRILDRRQATLERELAQ